MMGSIQRNMSWVPALPLARPVNASVSSLEVENFLKEYMLLLWLLLIRLGDGVVNQTFHLHSFLLKIFLFCLS